MKIGWNWLLLCSVTAVLINVENYHHHHHHHHQGGGDNE
jgi:hypothetical protein